MLHGNGEKSPGEQVQAAVGEMEGSAKHYGY